MSAAPVFAEEDGGPLVIAHRGASAVAPENTKSAIEEAIRLGAPVIEFDVRQTRDGELVLFHDDNFERVTGRKGAVETNDWKVVREFDVGSWFGDGSFEGETPIRIEDALKLCKDGGVIALVEHKSGDAKNYATAITRCKAEDCAIVQSFDWEFLEQFREEMPDLPLGALGSKRITAKRVEQLVRLGTDWVGWKFSDLSVPGFERLREAGFRVALYTINDPAEAQTWIERGADAIITDVPDNVLRLLSGEEAEVTVPAGTDPQD